ncbi:Myc-type, basic helix-loop-helix (bHLH) domain-containing protein [Cynara cardunculus var. scolymus]|uniref:Myc-type, basic helix-loop-helix (BHLH) domain-containing protein n=1 Tax=Cynara cardunculus var. scolymus TaxID=59895 RepID=A0A103Y8T3_CYNCS|nr:Myc-type, basic helix-loop-helix (bHLH) domain-containing protein [Cynara cardunculus var. scolymus]
MVGDQSTSLPEFFDSATSAEQFGETKFLSAGVASPDDIFSILEALEGVSDEFTALTPLDDHGVEEGAVHNHLLSQKSTSLSAVEELVEAELEAFSPKNKRHKVSSSVEEGCENSDGQLKMSHVTVERNRRKQMNEHLTVLRSLMPCFYVKRVLYSTLRLALFLRISNFCLPTGDQASIIGGVVDYITELQQVLQSLEAKKQRKVYSDVLSPRLISSPRTLPLSPRKPPLSPRPSLPISPRTPQSASPYRHRLPSYLLSPSSMANTTPASPCNSSSNSDTINELVANSKSCIADVEVKFSGSNLLLKTLSPRLPGQATKIISVLEDLSLEILQATINTIDETLVNSFTIKVTQSLNLI